jgi:hypothetical protein
MTEIEDYPAASCGECARYCGSKPMFGTFGFEISDFEINGLALML